METPKNRRTILKALVGTSVAAIAAPIVYVLGKYLSYTRTANPNASEKIMASDLSAATPSKIISIEEEPVIVVMEGTTIRAFTAKCTHLGCTVSFKPEQPGFFCKCHKGRYDLDGVNVPGTRPKRPLTELTVTQDGEQIEISLHPKIKA